ncbi:hypothetical protein BLA29_012779 [Euroglyphus maynei]|uniref:Uncharacterized protein n=1 Tax=Euroglyphus maynei TaxID=6958 RepID=A0A1Y3BH56_EURMA|nr:hypothetical protein BLA29_012779 [Euroglyphus maynei]
MGKSSKRYFSSSSHHHRRSRSPDMNRSSSKSSLHGSSSTRSTSFDTNKHASEKLKNKIKEQINESKKTTTAGKLFIPVEEQIKMMNKIDEINYDPFKPKNFISNRSAGNKIPSTTSNNSNVNINLADIPLPKDMNSWQENSRLLLAPKVII